MQPAFGAFNKLVYGFRTFVAHQLGLAFLSFYPQLGVARVAVNDHVVTLLLLEQGQGMHDSQKLTNVVGTFYRTIVKDLLTRFQIDTAVFHFSRIAGAGSVYSQSLGFDFRREGKYGVMTIVGGLGACPTWGVPQTVSCGWAEAEVPCAKA